MEWEEYCEPYEMRPCSDLLVGMSLGSLDFGAQLLRHVIEVEVEVVAQQKVEEGLLGGEGR